MLECRAGGVAGGQRGQNIRHNNIFHVHNFLSWQKPQIKFTNNDNQIKAIPMKDTISSWCFRRRHDPRSGCDHIRDTKNPVTWRQREPQQQQQRNSKKRRSFLSPIVFHFVSLLELIPYQCYHLFPRMPKNRQKNQKKGREEKVQEGEAANSCLLQLPKLADKISDTGIFFRRPQPVCFSFFLSLYPFSFLIRIKQRH